MVDQVFITEMDPLQRMNRLAELLDFDRALQRGVFDGAIFADTLSYFEAFYRWATVGRMRSDGDQVKRRLELRGQEIWGPQSIAVRSQIMPRIAEVVSYNAKIAYPISEWSIGELTAEYVRLDGYRDVYAIIAGIGTAVGIARTGVGLAAAARVETARRIAALTGTPGLVFSAATMAIAGIAYWQCHRTMGEIEEEIQDVRIDRGEITLEAWNALFREMSQS